MNNRREKSLRNVGYLLLIVLLLVVAFVMLGVVYPWLSEGLGGGVERVEVDRQAAEHGHSHDAYDHSHEEKILEGVGDFEKSFEKAGYEIVFFDPEYIDSLGVRLFEMRVRLVNNEFESYAGQALVCDVAEGEKVVVNGKGVKMSALKDVYPGDSLEWKVTVRYEGDDWWVSGCRYTPTGSFEPSKTVEVELPQP